jgi:hypothetical protein
MKTLDQYSSAELEAELKRRWEAETPPKLYYYGVWPSSDGAVGHHFRDKAGFIDASAYSFFEKALSGQDFYPWSSRECKLKEQEQGLFYPKAAIGVSGISCWDRSGDRRYNSCSAFFAQKILSPRQILHFAQIDYPAVFARMASAGIVISWL